MLAPRPCTGKDALQKYLNIALLYRIMLYAKIDSTEVDYIDHKI